MSVAFDNVPSPTVPTTESQTTTLSSEPLPLGISIPPVSADMSPEQLAQILDAAPLVRQWLKEAEEMALSRMMSGEAIPDYKVIRTATRRTWGLKGADLEAKLKGMGLKKADMLKEVVLTPKQVESCDTVKGWTERKKRNLQALIVKPEGALKIVSVSTEGEPVVTNTVDAFADVPSIPVDYEEGPQQSTPTTYDDLSFL